MIDTLGDRMKRYEKVYSHTLTPNSCLFIRVDGRAFHTFTRGLEKPFDQTLIDAMVYAARCTMKEMQGVQAAYIQSDECTFMLTDTATHETQGWFDYELNKVVSLSASAYTAYFNTYWQKAHGWPSYPDVAMFDSRAFIVPEGDAANAFIWRQRDWERNSLQMLARKHFSHGELFKKKTHDMVAMLNAKGVLFDDLNDQLKYGTFLFKNNTKPVFKQYNYDTLTAMLHKQTQVKK